MKEDVNKLIPDSTGKDREKARKPIFPLHDVFVRKVKMLKKPQFEEGKLTELHGEGSSSGKVAGMRQVLKLNKLMDTSQESKNLFKMKTFNGDKQKILFVVKKKRRVRHTLLSVEKGVSFLHWKTLPQSPYNSGK